MKLNNRGQVLVLFVIMFPVIFFIVAPELAGLIGYPEKYEHIKMMLSWGVVIVFFNSISEFFKEIFIGLEKYKVVCCLTIVEYGSYVCALLVYLRLGIMAPVFAFLTGTVIVSFVSVCWFVEMQGDFWHFSRDSIMNYFEPIFEYAVPLAVIGIGSVVLTEMDTFFLGVLSTREEIAFYGIGKNITSKLAHVNYAIATGTITSIVGKVDKTEEVRQVNKANHLNLYLSYGIFVGLLIGAGLYISVVYGRNFENAEKIIRFLSPYFLFNGMSTFYATYMDFMKKARIRSGFYILMIIINFILDILLIPNYGAMGACVATDIAVIPYFIGLFINFKKLNVVERRV